MLSVRSVAAQLSKENKMCNDLAGFPLNEHHFLRVIGESGFYEMPS